MVYVYQPCGILMSQAKLYQLDGMDFSNFGINSFNYFLRTYV